MKKAILPDINPDHDPADPELHLATHRDSAGHKTPGETLVTFLVITLGFALAFILAALHLGEP